MIPNDAGKVSIASRHCCLRPGGLLPQFAWLNGWHQKWTGRYYCWTWHGCTWRAAGLDIRDSVEIGIDWLLDVYNFLKRSTSPFIYTTTMEQEQAQFISREKRRRNEGTVS